jgi:hypothetical protein
MTWSAIASKQTLELKSSWRISRYLKGMGHHSHDRSQERNWNSNHKFPKQTGYTNLLSRVSQGQYQGLNSHKPTEQSQSGAVSGRELTQTYRAESVRGSIRVWTHINLQRRVSKEQYQGVNLPTASLPFNILLALTSASVGVTPGLVAEAPRCIAAARLTALVTEVIVVIFTAVTLLPSHSRLALTPPLAVTL